MTEHVHAALDEETDGGRPPSYRRRRVVAIVIAVVLIGIVAIAGVAAVRVGRNIFDFSSPDDYSGSGSGSVVVQVHDGDTLAAIGQTLYSKQVVASVEAFTDAADANPDATSIGPGYYRLHEHMQATLALSLMLDPGSHVQSVVTIPEGRRVRDILPAIASATDISLADLRKAADAPEKLGVPSWGAGHPLEGFLFPATYSFPPKTTATDALRTMVSKFNSVADSVGLVDGARNLGYSPYDVLTLASIIEREGRLTDDFPKIAEVFYNRLQMGMPLQSDATLFYALPDNHGPLTNSDLRLDSPYNTRINAGLPPTPIASPGELALKAALQPAQGDYLYFVTIDKAGHTAFAKTLTEFNRLVAESRANGVQ